jgi:hypothetical protein
MISTLKTKKDTVASLDASLVLKQQQAEHFNLSPIHIDGLL